jgi:hypothetical protein
MFARSVLALRLAEFTTPTDRRKNGLIELSEIYDVRNREALFRIEVSRKCLRLV